MYTCTAPLGYPNDIKVISKGSDFITYSWKELPCHNRNGHIVGYIVAHYWSEDEKSIPVSRSVKTSSTTYTARHLKPFMSISFQVAAFNNAGTGDFSPPFTVKTRPPPEG